MFRFPSHPFLKAHAEAVGGTSAPLTASPDRAPIKEATSYPTPSPTSLDGGARGMLDEDDFGGMQEGSEEPAESGKPTSGSKFDPSRLDPALQPAYQELKAEFERQQSSLPSREVLERMGQKSAAFDRLLGSEEFQKWAASFESGEDQPKADLSAIPGLEGLEEESLNALSEFIQNKIDEEVGARVDPVAQTVWNREADRILSDLRNEIGAETFDGLRAQATQYMEDIEGLGPKEAYRLAEFDALKQKVEAFERQTTTRKLNARMEGDGAVGTAPARGEVSSARDAIVQAMKQFEQGTAWDPRAYTAQHRGEG